MKMFIETLNKRIQCVPYLYACKVNKMAVPWRYPLTYQGELARNKTLIVILSYPIIANS